MLTRLASTVLFLVTMTAQAANTCHSVRVQGCGRKARICVQTGSTADAEQRALKAFKEQYRCATPTVSSYSSSCSESANDRCDVRL